MKKIAALLIGCILGQLLVPILLEKLIILTREPYRCKGGMDL
jgi:hypothetical protein